MSLRLPAFLLLPVLAFGFAAAATTTHAGDFSTPQRAEIESIVREYLLANPEVIRDAVVELQKRKDAEETATRNKVLSESADMLYRSTHQAVVGNPNGKITLVEFFDYNCGYCKKSLSDVGRLTKEIPELRVVLKDLPVLGPQSVEAARVEAAVRNQFTGDKFFDFHAKLLNGKGRIGKPQAVALAKEMGADMGRLEADMRKPEIDQGIAEVEGVAQKLSLNGTPSWILGDDVIIGAVGYDELREKIGNMQRCGKSVCS